MILIDTISPEWTFVPGNYTLECTEEIQLDEAVAIDVCGSVSVEVNQQVSFGDCSGEYTITRVFTATDECGNASIAFQTIFNS